MACLFGFVHGWWVGGVRGRGPGTHAPHRPRHGPFPSPSSLPRKQARTHLQHEGGGGGGGELVESVLDPEEGEQPEGPQEGGKEGGGVAEESGEGVKIP